MTPDDKPLSDDDTWTDDEESMTESEAFQIALGDHPELRDLFLSDSLPEEMLDDDGNVWNPRSHLDLHAVIERQIAMDEPRGIVGVAAQLEELKIDHHEIRHLIAGPLSEQIWHMLQEKRPFNERQYLRQLRAIVQEHSGDEG